MAKKSIKKTASQTTPETGTKNAGKTAPTGEVMAAKANTGKTSLQSVTPPPAPAIAPASQPKTTRKKAVTAAAPVPVQKVSDPAPAVVSSASARPLPAPAQPVAQLARMEAAHAPVASQPAPLKVKAAFVLVDSVAKSVFLSGEFNGWSSSATPLQLREAGKWETTISLAPGRYQYKFVVDGDWKTDPQAQEQVWNEHGTLNSVIEIKA